MIRDALGFVSRRQTIYSEAIFQLPKECHRQIESSVPMIVEETGEAMLCVTAKVVNNSAVEFDIPLKMKFIDSRKLSKTVPGVDGACAGNG